MKKIIPLFFCVILLSGHASFSVATAEEAMRGTAQTEHRATIAREDYEWSPAGTAAYFAKKKDEQWKNQKAKQLSIRCMKSSQKDADRYRKKKNYYLASERYRDAAICNPNSLLFFKNSDMDLYDAVNQEKIRYEALKFILENYNLGLEFYQYEPEGGKSMSQNCLKKMRMKTNCLQDVYNAYSNSSDDFTIPKNDIFQCMKLGADIFQSENYCK